LETAVPAAGANPEPTLVASDPGVVIADGQDVPSLSDQEVQALGEIVRDLVAGQPVDGNVPAMLAGSDVAAYVALRWNGAPLGSGWASGPTGLDSLEAAIGQAMAELPAENTVEIVEIDLAHSFETLPPEDWNMYLDNIHRGIYGMELQHEGRTYRYGPTGIIANNRSFASYIDAFQERRGLGDAAIGRDVTVRRFQAEQFLVRLEPELEVVRMFRGNQLVLPSEVTRANVEALAERMGDWMVRNVDDSGRMTYKYWPSSGEYSTSNNMIRQWMATIALTRIARERNDAELFALAEKNIRFNLNNFYREENGLGLIEHDDTVKLGAVALAALAIVEHPNRAAFAEEEAALRRTVHYLWREDGSFRTFYKPADRNDNQNFYPGEALLLWANLYRQSDNAELRHRFAKSYEYYGKWHLENRNPAFVPWHTQAYYMMWQETQVPALKDWIFAMNDWLLGMQPTASAQYPDTDGRFYDPERPQFGPPHASSTGSYLEGLVDAFALARQVGDTAREEAYRLAIVRGLRNALQLEFADDVDMYYISRRARVRGALRTTVYDNEIRVDNVQHMLMAVQKVLATFDDKDFGLRPPPSS
jgi:hypothetical protein